MTGWYLLTGKNPIEGAADAIIQERLSAAEYEALLPPELTGRPRAVLARMIRKNPADRYPGSLELLAELRACLQSMPRLAGGWQHRQRRSGALTSRFTREKGVASRQGLLTYSLME